MSLVGIVDQQSLWRPVTFSLQLRPSGCVRSGPAIFKLQTQHRRKMETCGYLAYELSNNNVLLHGEVRGNPKIVEVQLGLPRALRNVDQACQVNLVNGNGALQLLSLDAFAFLSDQTRPYRTHSTRLDVCLDLLPNLLRQFAAQDWFPFGGLIVGVHLSRESAVKVFVVVRKPCLGCIRAVPDNLIESTSARTSLGGRRSAYLDPTGDRSSLEGTHLFTSPIQPRESQVCGLRN